jgi:8-oxo-dGTP pyrophosphatase MutT (NUDIX family)
MPAKGMRPRDAASLILLRGEGRGTEVLMGRREPRQTFMPGVFVFPGGAVDRSDGFVRSADELRPGVLTALTATCTPHRARAIALAAIRETFEETGLMLGRPGALAARPAQSWRAFAEAGIAPALGAMDYVARAITPPGPPRRYHARFFLVRSAEAVGSLAGNGELLELDWYPLQTTFGLPIAGVTQLVLKEVTQIVSGATAGATTVPFFTRRRGRRLISYD